MISPAYLTESTQQEIALAFKRNGFIRLDQFFEGRSYLAFSQPLWDASGKAIVIPDRHSYTLLPPSLASTPFMTPSFKKFLSTLVGKKITTITLTVQRFGWKDYTLVHDDEVGKEELRFFFLISGKWEVERGGILTYLTQNGEGEPLFFPITGNSFCIIRQRKDMHSFVKYVNHHAGKEKFIVVAGILT